MPNGHSEVNNMAAIERPLHGPPDGASDSCQMDGVCRFAIVTFIRRRMSHELN